MMHVDPASPASIGHPWSLERSRRAWGAAFSRAAAGRPLPAARARASRPTRPRPGPQVTRLCHQHRLHTALASLFTRALGDWAAPAAELLLAAAAAPAETTPPPGGPWGERAAAVYKALVFLRCAFRGHALPPGAGGLPAGMAGLVRAQARAPRPPPPPPPARRRGPPRPAVAVQCCGRAGPRAGGRGLRVPVRRHADVAITLFPMFGQRPVRLWAMGGS